MSPSKGSMQPWPSPIPQDGLSLMPQDDHTPAWPVPGDPAYTSADAHATSGNGNGNGTFDGSDGGRDDRAAAVFPADGDTAADNPESSGGTRSWGSPASWPSTPTPYAGTPGTPAPVSWPDAAAPEPSSTGSRFFGPVSPAEAPGATPPPDTGENAGLTRTAFDGPAAPAPGTATGRPVWNTAGSAEAAFVPVAPADPEPASEWFTHVEPRLSDPAAPATPPAPGRPETPGTTPNTTELTLTAPAFPQPGPAPAPAATQPGPADGAAAQPRAETLSQNGWAERPPVVDLWADADGTAWTTTPTAPQPVTSPQLTTSPQLSPEPPPTAAMERTGAPQPTGAPWGTPEHPPTATSQPTTAPWATAEQQPFASQRSAPPQPAGFDLDGESRTFPAVPETAPEPGAPPAAAPGWDEPAPRDDPYAMYRRPASGAETPAWDTTPSWASPSAVPGDPDRGTREQPPLRSPDAAVTGWPAATPSWSATDPNWSGRAERVAEGQSSGARDDRADGTMTTGRDQVPGRDRSQPAGQPSWSDVPAPPAHLATPPPPGPDRPAPPGRRSADRRAASTDHRATEHGPAESGPGEHGPGEQPPGRREAKPRHGAESDVRVLSTYTGDAEEKPRRRGLGILVAAAVVAVAVAGGGLAALRGVPGLNLAAAGNGPHAISAPLDGRDALTFDLVSGVTSVSVTSDDLEGDLYRISTPEDSSMRPEAIDQGDRLMLQMAETGQRGPSLVEVRLSSEVRWDVRLTGGATEHVVDFSAGRLAGFDVLGGATRLELTLPEPEKSVRLKVSSGISQLVLRTPEDVPSRLRFAAGADSVTLLGDARGRVAPNSRFTPKAWEDADDRYDIAITGGVGTFTLEQ
ncbi:hypothetical protein J2S43_008389 [Catenuloplanes nepalensis]|uniref:Uncharacterized protein n=1 Tax=Catenuloplanes nepalensis TaxID=587533 RepID=A0ABT9N848_9ACTN|nr:hypothetical protein [Catenuloplanes nepalensis]MDP9799877.1 hypothetical protein [Catenuloplanes nepalensis]